MIWARNVPPSEGSPGPVSTGLLQSGARRQCPSPAMTGKLIKFERNPSFKNPRTMRIKPVSKASAMAPPRYSGVPCAANRGNCCQGHKTCTLQQAPQKVSGMFRRWHTGSGGHGSIQTDLGRQTCQLGIGQRLRDQHDRDDQCNDQVVHSGLACVSLSPFQDRQISFAN